MQRPIDTVELFGCDGLTETIALEPYPWLVYLGAGTFIEENDLGYLAVCGGYTCEVDFTGCDVAAGNFLNTYQFKYK